MPATPDQPTDVRCLLGQYFDLVEIQSYASCFGFEVSDMRIRTISGPYRNEPSTALRLSGSN